MSKIIAPGSKRLSPGLMRALTNMPRTAQLSDVAQDSSVKSALDSMSKSGVFGRSSGQVVLRRSFIFQSFLDVTKGGDPVTGGERAILSQPPAEPIVPSTKIEENTAGYGLGLYPTSDCPVAVQLLLGGGNSASPAFILRPGETFMSRTKFDGVRYGLPFGWLGGGVAQLRIFQNPSDRAYFLTGKTELAFHRIRVPVRANNANPASVAPNWPIHFPWPNAFDQNNNVQKGQPSISIEPTKIVLRLRKNGAGLANARMRLLLLKTDDLDLQSDGVTYDGIGTSGTWIDFNWPAGNTASGFQIGGTATAEFPQVTLNDEVTRLAGDNAIMVLIDMDGAIGAANVDIERFGAM